MTRVFELRWGVEKKTTTKGDGGNSSCENKRTVTAAGSDKSAVGAEEMMM